MHKKTQQKGTKIYGCSVHARAPPEKELYYAQLMDWEVQEVRSEIPNEVTAHRSHYSMNQVCTTIFYIHIYIYIRRPVVGLGM